MPAKGAERGADSAQASPTPAGLAAPTPAAVTLPVSTPTPAGLPVPTPPPAPPAPGKAPAAAAEPTPSTNVTINLVHLLVKRGVLSQEDADGLIKQAESDAAAARAQQEEALGAAAQAAVAQAAAAGGGVPQTEPGLSPAFIPGADDSVRVTYIPDNVKNQIRDDIKADVMKEAEAEGWAAPNSLPDWVKQFRLSGDVRIRYEGDHYPAGNDNTGAFPNFNAINTGAPFDTAGTEFPPENDVDQDRTQFRLRARLGAEVDMGDGFTAGIRIGTGQNDSPVTENQSLGLANNGQGGDFSKYSVWLDRGFIKYELGGMPEKDVAVTIGRFDNPFFRPSTVLWANDLGFDGIVLQGRYNFIKNITSFLNAGAFPVFDTDFNFATNNPSKFKSEDKYLYGLQAGNDWKINKDFDLTIAAAYYYFQNIQGKLSDPFTPLSASDQGNTDDSRPSFAQNGNTYMALRDIVPTAANDYGTIDQYQYYGLATAFHELDLAGKLEFNHFEPFQVTLKGELVKNLAFNSGAINAVAVNNRGPNTASGSIGAFAGGGVAWIVDLTLGKPKLEKRWDWDLGINYRYLESDSVVDGFNDNNFGAPLSGTNLKGFTAYGDLALSPSVWLAVRWMSAEAIAGPPFKNDILQIDVNAKF